MTPRKLYPYQIEGAEWLARRRVAAIADDPGLGKTAQASAALDQYVAAFSFTDQDPIRVLVVTSAVARIAWTRELEYCKAFKSGSADVAVVSWDALSRMTPGDFASRPLDVIIFDEAHYMKSPDAKRTKVALALAQRTLANIPGAVWLLSGTLMPNHPGELYVPAKLYSILRGVPNILTNSNSAGPMLRGLLDDPGQWTEFWCRTRQTTYGTQVTGVRKDRLHILRRFMKTFVLRRRKADVLPDLPPLAIHEERLPLDVLAPGARDGMKDASVTIAAGILKLDPMADTSDKSTMLADNAAIRALLEDPHFSVARRKLGFHKAPACADWILEQLHVEPKAVVFAHHIEVLGALATRFRSELGQNAVELIDGSTPTAQRGRIVDRFQNDPTLRVLVGQLKAAGTGITLTASKLAVIIEPSGVPSDNIQAFCRVHRIGTKDGARGVFLSIEGTMDANLVAAQYRKARDAHALFD